MSILEVEVIIFLESLNFYVYIHNIKITKIWKTLIWKFLWKINNLKKPWYYHLLMEANFEVLLFLHMLLLCLTLPEVVINLIKWETVQGFKWSDTDQFKNSLTITSKIYFWRFFHTQSKTTASQNLKNHWINWNSQILVLLN